MNGSKFLSEWTIEVVVEWLKAEIEARDWRFPPEASEHVRVRLDREVGIVEGRRTRTIMIFANGRYVHAFPDSDET